MPSHSVITDLATFGATRTLADLSPLATERVIEHLIDTVGVGLAGATEPGGRIMLELVSGAEVAGGARALGSTRTILASEAAWANGALTNMLDFDDTGFTHPSVCIVPAALAAAEAEDISGAELVLALAVGYEVCAKMNAVLGGVFNARLRRRGIHPMSVCGTIAAAAAASKVFNLDADRTLVALGLAATSSFGITEQFGTWAKGLHAGNAARAGVNAAQLARRDFFASPTAIEGQFGMLNALAGEGNYDLEKGRIVAGAEWAIAEPGCDTKLHPLCGATRGMVQAALVLRDRLPGPQDIDRVVISVPERLLDSIRFTRPVRGYEGKFSATYPVAAALLDGEVTIDSFSDERLNRPDMQQFLDRVELAVRAGAGMDPKERHETPVKVILRDGTVHVENVLPHPRGTRQNRLSTEEIESKFRTCAARVLGPTQVEAALSALRRVRDIKVRHLVDTISGIS